MTAVRSEWSPGAVKRRAFYRASGLSAADASKAHRAEVELKGRVGARLGKRLADAARIKVRVIGDDLRFTLAIDDGILTDEERRTVAVEFDARMVAIDI
jgi:hypothetical protein